MMTKGKHMIRNQIIQFQYNGTADGFALQKEVSDWCYSILIPEMEQVFDSISRDDIFITIDRLEIDAEVDHEDWQEKLRNEVLMNLKEELNNHNKAVEEIENTEETPLRKMDELILFYFEKGYLPWWSKMMLEGDFKSMLMNWVAEGKSNARENYILENLEKIMSPDVVLRVVNILSPSYLFILLKSMYKWNEKFLNSMEEFVHSSKKIVGENEKEILNLTFQFLAAIGQKNVLEDKSALHFYYLEVKKETGVDLEIFNEMDQIDKSSVRNKKEKKDVLKKLEPGIDKDSVLKDLAEGIYIENAGAVIFAAFLPGLFQKLKLVQKGEMLNPPLAALIIQFAVSGNLEMEEYELVLPKILCGLDIESVINPGLKISREQSTEVNEMLTSLIEHWSVLKKTSIPGLQENFLKRSGKLTGNENSWLLQVEQKSYDVLLNQLPWNISMIKLPWMEGVLRTEWV